MKPVAAILRAGLFGVVVLLIGSIAIGGIGMAETYSAGGLQIGNPWARATPKGSTVTAGYLTITNKGTEADRLIGGTAAPASRFEVHDTVTEKGVARMRQVTSLEIKPGQTIELKPGGMHVMLMGLKQPLSKGQTVKGTLVFEKAGTVAIEFAVLPPGAPAPAGGHGGHKH
jgi:periplasmic copper chaperone A